MKKILILYIFFTLFFTNMFAETQDIPYSEFLNTHDFHLAPVIQQSITSLIPDASKRKQITFEKLTGGLTDAEILSFMYGSSKYVLRLFDPKHPLTIRKNEVTAQRIGHDLKIAPACLFIDDHYQLIVMPFVPGHPIEPHDIQNNAFLKKLGTTLRTLHSYKGNYPSKYSVADKIRYHYSKGIISCVAYPSGFTADIQERLNTISVLDESLVPCHGDLNLSNILYDGDEITLIDWNNATWDTPYSDLAFVSCAANLDFDREYVLLKSYFGRYPTESELNKLNQAKLNYFLLVALIWFGHAESLEDKEIPIAERSAKLDVELKSPALKSGDLILKDRDFVDLHSEDKIPIRQYALGFYKTYLQNLGSKSGKL